MSAKRAPRAAVALVRISSDRHGTAVGVQRQEEDCRELAARLGWTLAEVVVENDTSAFKTRTFRDEHGRTRRRTIRPGFERTLDALDDGTADGLIVYDIDRLARQPYDLERLIDIVTVRKAPVVAVTGSVDLSTSGGIAMARVLVAMASKSSEDTARRVTRAHRQAAEAGRPMGGQEPYGFRRVGTGPDSRIIPDPDEAAVIRRIAAQLLDGDTPFAIARALTDEGIVPRRGGRWRSQSITGVVSKPSVAGLRQVRREGETRLVAGQWEPILDRETWEAVRLVTSPRRRRTTPNRAAHLCSGIATCGLCGTALHFNVMGPRRYPVYKCPGCNRSSKSQPALDELVVDVVTALLERPEVAELRARNASAQPGRAAVELDAYRARRTDLLRSIALDLSGEDRTVMLAALDERIADLEAEVASSAGVVAMPAPVAFVELPLERQRAVVRELLRIVVRPGASRRAEVSITPAY